MSCLSRDLKAPHLLYIQDIALFLRHVVSHWVPLTGCIISISLMFCVRMRSSFHSHSHAQERSVDTDLCLFMGVNAAKKNCDQKLKKRSQNKTAVTWQRNCIQYIGFISVVAVNAWSCGKRPMDGSTLMLAATVTLATAAVRCWKSSEIPANVGTTRRALLARKAFSRDCFISIPFDVTTIAVKWKQMKTWWTVTKHLRACKTVFSLKRLLRSFWWKKNSKEAILIDIWRLYISEVMVFWK